MPADWLLAAAALHLGFQATITVLVYPALSRVPPERWTAEHDRHSRAIVPLVAVVYVLLVAACVGVVVSGLSVATAVAVAGAFATVAVTAFSAAPMHGRLAAYDAGLLHRLLRVDRLRLAAATLCLLAALVGVITQ